MGQGFAFLLIVFGVIEVFQGNFLSGLWIAFIGWFLDGAAARSYQQMAVQEVLSGHTVREAMTTDCPRVPRRLTLDVLVDQVVLPSGKHCFPVVEDGQLLGLLTLDRIKHVPGNRRQTTRVQDVMIPRAELKTVRADDQLTTILERMGDEDVDQFPVVDDGRLVGVVARDSLLNFISLQGEFTSRNGSTDGPGHAYGH